MKKKIAYLAILFIATIFLFCACGGTEPTVTEYGVGGFVYVPHKILIESLNEGIRSFQAIEDSLYFCQSTSGVDTVKSLPLQKVEEAIEKWNFNDTGTPVLAVSTIAVQLPEDALESEQEPDYLSFLDIAMDPKRIASSPSMSQRMTIEPAADYCKFYVDDYMADKDGNLTFSIGILAGSYFEMDTVGYFLCRQDKDGAFTFQIFCPQAPDFTVDGKGRIFLLTEDGICILDQNGRTLDLLLPGNYQYAKPFYQKFLYGDGEDSLYYLNPGKAGFARLTEKDGEFQLEELKGLDSSGSNYFATPDGLLYSNVNGEILYQWNRESASSTPLLKWQDCDIVSSYIRSVAPTASGNLLVVTFGIDSGMYLLTKTPLEELPQKEILVLASLYPSYTLFEEVMDFNRTSSEYRVIIERYGASGYGIGDDPEADERLDATLASANPPDLLDLSSLELLKYTDKNALLDLTPYLENSGFHREDFMENVLDSFTINGRLVCIPTGLLLNGFYGRASVLNALSSWTMEDVYLLTKQNPEATLFYSETRDYALQTFCAPYYLEEFVDWTDGTCNFDSQEFRQLILWIEQSFPESHDGYLAYNSHFPDDVLLTDVTLINFLEPLSYEAQFGEEIQLRGFPGAEGDGKVSATLLNALGITSNSNHKESAWKFLAHHLASNEASYYGVTFGSFFPTRKSQLDERLQVAAEEMYVHIGEDGNPVVEDGKVTRFEYDIDGETIGYLSVPPRLYNDILSALENLDLIPRSRTENLIIDIVSEETASYYNGDKTLDEVIDIIQSRVQILVQENTLAH